MRGLDNAVEPTYEHVTWSAPYLLPEEAEEEMIANVIDGWADGASSATTKKEEEEEGGSWCGCGCFKVMWNCVKAVLGEESEEEETQVVQCSVR